MDASRVDKIRKDLFVTQKYGTFPLYPTVNEWVSCNNNYNCNNIENVDLHLIPNEIINLIYTYLIDFSSENAHTNCEMEKFDTNVSSSHALYSPFQNNKICQNYTILRFFNTNNLFIYLLFWLLVCNRWQSNWIKNNNLFNILDTWFYYICCGNGYFFLSWTNWWI